MTSLVPRESMFGSTPIARADSEQHLPFEPEASETGARAWLDSRPTAPDAWDAESSGHDACVADG